MSIGNAARELFLVHKKTVTSAGLIFAVMGSVVAVNSELNASSSAGLEAKYAKLAPDAISVGSIPSPAPTSANSNTFIKDKRIHISLAGCFHTAQYLNCELQLKSLISQNSQLSFLISAGASANHKAPHDFFSLKTEKAEKIENHDIKILNTQSTDNPLLLKQHSAITMTIRFNDVPKTITKLKNLTVKLDKNSLQFGDVKIKNL